MPKAFRIRRCRSLSTFCWNLPSFPKPSNREPPPPSFADASALAWSSFTLEALVTHTLTPKKTLKRSSVLRVLDMNLTMCSDTTGAVCGLCGLCCLRTLLFACFLNKKQTKLVARPPGPRPARAASASSSPCWPHLRRAHTKKQRWRRQQRAATELGGGDSGNRGGHSESAFA